MVLTCASEVTTVPVYRNSIIDGQAYMLVCPFSVFTPKQVFGPGTAKSQPIWIKFYTHLLYGIHLWAT